MKKKNMIALWIAPVFCISLLLAGCTRRTDRADGLDEITWENPEAEDAACPEETYVPGAGDGNGEAGMAYQTGTADQPGGAADPAGGDAMTEFSGGDEAAARICYVYICGAVQSPGVYEMERGDRIFSVIGKAGGFAEGACQDYVNQALAVADGMKIWIPTQEEAAKLPEPGQAIEGACGQTAESEASKGLVNINTATKEQLCTLTGIGEAKAEAIIAYRSEKGNFSEKEDIMKVTGIKQAGYDKIKEQITVN